MKRRYKLIQVLREGAARMFQVNLATKTGKAQFVHVGGTIGGKVKEFTFQCTQTKRFYHLQTNHCVIVYEHL